jgi:hypothetical protein
LVEAILPIHIIWMELNLSHLPDTAIHVSGHGGVVYLDAVRLYEKTDAVTMGSALSPVITNFFIEDLKEMAIDPAAHKALCRLRGRLVI